MANELFNCLYINSWFSGVLSKIFLIKMFLGMSCCTFSQIVMSLWLIYTLVISADSKCLGF